MKMQNCFLAWQFRGEELFLDMLKALYFIPPIQQSLLRGFMVNLLDYIVYCELTVFLTES